MLVRGPEGETDSVFGVNGDSIVDDGGRRYWIEQLKGTLIADVNLDGVVDGSDLNFWNNNNLLTNTLWESGDYNGDRKTDDANFFLWQTYAFIAPDAHPASVPEPIGTALVVEGALFCLANARRSFRSCALFQS